MSIPTAPADWPSNMSSEDRKAWAHEAICKWVGEKRVNDALSAAELGNLSHLQKAVAFRSLLIVGSIRHCRANPRAEVRIPLLTLITFLSDNAQGVCYISISRMQELLHRSRQCIVDNITALEQDGAIGVTRSDGMPSRYWPRIPAALAEINPNPVWFIEALTSAPKQRIYANVEDAIAAATDRSSAVDQSSRLDQRRSSSADQYPSSGVDRYGSSRVDPTGQVEHANRSSPAREPVKSNTDSISTINLFSSSQATQGGRAPTTGRGTRLSADWQLPDDWKAWTRANFRVSEKMIHLEADKFADHWTSKPGQGGVKLDWRKTWCNWCRTAFSRFYLGNASQANGAGDSDRAAYLDQLQGARSLET